MGHSIGELFASRLRRIIVAAVVIIVLLWAAAYAYWTSLPSPTGPSVTLTSPPLEFSMSLDKTNYLTTDNITVCFSLRNISNKTVTVTKTSAYGLDPNYPGFRLTTSAEGVSAGSYLHSFHFYFSWVDSNGTVVFDTRDLIPEAIAYDLVFEPNGCVNQTLRISPKDYFDIPGYRPLTGVFQIRGFLYGVYIDGARTVTLATPGIAFAID